MLVQVKETIVKLKKKTGDGDEVGTNESLKGRMTEH